jgi:hypothetical protein
MRDLQLTTMQESSLEFLLNLISHAEFQGQGYKVTIAIDESMYRELEEIHKNLTEATDE